jgi:hypothetical protein
MRMSVDRQRTEYGYWIGLVDADGVVRLGVEIHDPDRDADEQGFVSVYWTTSSHPSDLVSLLPDFDEQAQVYVPELVAPELGAPEDLDVALTVHDVADVISEDRQRFDDVVTFVRADTRSAGLVWQYALCRADVPLPVVAVMGEGFNPNLLEDLMRDIGDGDQVVSGEELPLHRLIARASDEVSGVAAF